MDLLSKVFDVTTSEKVTITRLDGGTFAFSSIYVDHLESANVAKEPVTVQPFLGAVPAAAAQTVLEGGQQTLVFNGVATSSVQITCDDFYFISLDNFSVCVPPSVSFSAAGLCLGTATSFTSTATQVLPGATYQWDFNNDNIVDATSPNASFTYPAAGTYTAKLTIKQGGCTSSAEKQVTISARPTAALSGGGTVCAGNSSTLSITLTGTPPWSVTYTDGTMPVTQSNVQTSPYTFSVTPASSKTYSLTAVANATCAGTVSGSAPVTVNTLPSIVNQPAGATRCIGEAVTFSVTATGTGLTYQWKKNGSNITGANGSSYTIPAVETSDADSYTVQVTGACGTPLTSGAAVLNVNQPPSITSQPESITVCQGGSTTFSVTASNATGYQWQMSMGSGFVNLNNNGMFSGVNTATLTITGAPTYLNEVRYRVLATGSCQPVTSNAATLSVSYLILVTEAPEWTTKCAGQPATFSVTAEGSSVSYQWKKDGNDIPGATNSTYSIASVSPANAGMYSVAVSGNCGAPVLTEGAMLTVNVPPTITGQPANVTICTSQNASFAVTASDAAGYQWQVDTGSGFVNVANNAIYGGATTGTLTVTGAMAGMNGYQYRAVVTGACPPTIISNVTTLAVGTPVTITRVNMLRGVCAGGPIDFNVEATGTGLTYQWKKDGIAIPGATGSSFTIPITTLDDSGFYTVTVNGACGSPVTSGSVPVQYEVPTAITSQPVPVAICAGSNASFTVGASNATGYQWQVNTGSGFVSIANGGLYSGVNTPTLLITAATTALNGYQYRAVASGACPTLATSDGAKLTVGNATALGSFTPVAAPVLVGTSVTMTIGFTGDAPATAVWHWGDGTTSNATVVGSTLTGTHVYATQNVYAPSIAVTSCGATATQAYQYVVVYDPSGGFITGSGWFNSPAGAYRPQPSLEGRVNFGFVSRYKKGTAVPDGNTQFQYRMGNLSFRSTAYEWLVISGAKGQFKGSGTINGTGNYGFILTAIDGGKRPDRLRMKIWNKANNAVVYDNQFGSGDTADPTTVITGGSILIKAPSKTAREGFDAAEAGAVLSSGPSAYPNPFRDRVTVDLSGLKPGKIRLDLTDGQGHPVHRLDVELKRDQSAVELELGDLKPGMYLLQARGNGDRKLIKLMKL
jgi:predicted secreted protein